MKNVLLLNPPGNHIYFRDYYCPKRSKAHYYYHPLDIVYLSGRFDCKQFNLTIIDAIASRQSTQTCLSLINSVNPDYIISLIASVSFEEDLQFIKSVKSANPHCKLIVSGDVCREDGEKLLHDTPFIDALLLDFSTDDCLVYCNRSTDEPIANIIYRAGDRIIKPLQSDKSTLFDTPLPRWDLFNLKQYSYPFALRSPFASILTDYGCPYTCTFCPVNSLGFKLRPIESVIDEMAQLKLLGVKELFFRDQTFGANSKRTAALCQTMIDRSITMTWTCFSRADVLTDELVPLMRRAGCHTAIIGIEAADQTILDRYRKSITLDQIRQSITLCHRNKIKVAGTFIIGLPGETIESTQSTISLSTNINLDYASFNVAAPLPGSQLRAEAIKNRWTTADEMTMDSGLTASVWSNTTLTNEQINTLRKKAIKSFYLRPLFLLKKLFSIRSITEMVEMMKTATGLFFPS